MKLFFVLILTVSGCAQSSPKYDGIGIESVSPNLLKKYAPKALDVETNRKIQPYMDLISPSAGFLSPSGKELFFTWKITGTPQVWKLTSPMAFPIQLTGGDDRNALAGQTPDGKWLIISKDKNGEENPGLYLLSPQGGSLDLIQHLPKVQTDYMFTTEDSKYLFFRSNDQDPKRYDIYRYDLKTRIKELVFSQEGTWSVADFKNENILLLKKTFGNRHSEYYEWDFKNKKLTEVLGQGEVEDYDVSYSNLPGEFLVLTDKWSEFARLYRFKHKENKWNRIKLKDDLNISNFAIDKKRTKIVVSYSKDAYFDALVLEASSGLPIAIRGKKTSEQIYPGVLSRNGKYLSFVYENYNEPNSSYVYNFETQKMTKWTISSIPEVDTSRFVKSSLEYYKTRDNVEIPMFVYRPEICRKQNCPVVVEFHGGPESMSVPGFNTEAQIYVQEGFIFVEPNIRGSSGYGKTWIESDDKEKRLNVITDIEDCAKFLRDTWAVNGVRPKIGITGGSYGGYATLVGMSMFAGSYDAGAAVVGMSNLVTFLKNTAPYRRHLRETEYGELEKDFEILKKLSPTSYLDRVKGPVMIIQGVNDPRVPAGEAIQIQELLSNRGLQSELLLFADEGHGISKRPNRVLELGHTLNFFKKHLR